MACELDDELRELYAKNFGITPHADIRDLRNADIPEHDVLAAGFPCQPFSKAGEQLGLACERDGDLFMQIVRILKLRQPQHLLLENVANLLRHDGGATWQWMQKQLRSAGYEVECRILSPADFGIPQVRDRLFIVGSRDGLSTFAWPEGTKIEPHISSVLLNRPDEEKHISEQFAACLDVWQDFLDRFPRSEELPSFPIWSMEFGATYPFEDTTPAQLTPRQLANYRGSHGVELGTLKPDQRMAGLPKYAHELEFADWKKQFIRQNRALYAKHAKWIDVWKQQVAVFPPSLQKFEWNCKGFTRSVWKTIVQFRASGVRVKRPSTAPALIAMTTTQVPIIAWKRRYMTVRECAGLQSLGDLQHLPARTGRAYKALGNAVNASLVQLVANSLVVRV